MNIEEILNSKQTNIKKWLKIFSLLKNNSINISEIISDDAMRRKIQFFCVYVIFVVISICMTIMNSITHWYRLGSLTLIFGIMNLINAILCLINEKTEKISWILFAIEIEVLFMVFAVIGDPEGFSIIWVALLPACGMLLYSIKYGTLLSLIQLLSLVVLFWTPIGRSMLQYNYTDTFLMRFPILYTAFYFVGLFFELVRVSTYTELLKARNQFEYMAVHDALTGLFNRNGFNKWVNTFLDGNYSKKYSFAICDIDHFKTINDKYGHTNGDIVLRDLANKITDSVGEDGIVCRWGGEEFAIFFNPECDSTSICSRLLEEVEQTEFVLGDLIIHITISIGLAIVPDNCTTNAKEIITTADTNLYYAKRHGRNMLKVSTVT